MEIPENFIFEALGRVHVELAVTKVQRDRANQQLAAAMARISELESAPKTAPDADPDCDSCEPTEGRE